MDYGLWMIPLLYWCFIRLFTNLAGLILSPLRDGAGHLGPTRDGPENPIRAKDHRYPIRHIVSETSQIRTCLSQLCPEQYSVRSQALALHVRTSRLDFVFLRVRPTLPVRTETSSRGTHGDCGTSELKKNLLSAGLQKYIPYFSFD